MKLNVCQLIYHTYCLDKYNSYYIIPGIDTNVFDLAQAIFWGSTPFVEP